MASNVSFNSTNSDVFFLEQVLNEPTPQHNNTPNVLNSMELSGTHTTKLLTLFSVTSPETVIVNNEADSNEPTIPYGLGIQQPIIPTSLNDLNLQLNTTKILATRAVIQADLTQHD